MAREIIVAAKSGADPDTNLRLRVAIEKAKENSLPRENIERAIAKGSGNVDGENYEEIVYEGTGPGGVAFMVEVFSENRNRTVSELRHAFSKNGGALAENGAVAWKFKYCGQIYVPKDSIDEDTLTLAALDAGAEDVKTDDEESYVIETTVANLHKTSEALKQEGIKVTEAELTRLPTDLANPKDEDIPKLIKLLDAIDDLDDVKETYVNFEFSDDMYDED